ncbi:MAG: hypothetical protein IJ493_08875 [Clostridia bacterium]|nr:hypothetical protein [Clostridia bacterium]
MKSSITPAKLSLILTLSLLASSAASCGETTVQPSDTTTADTSSDVTTAVGYVYPAEGFDGEEFHIMNINELYSVHQSMEREESNGETLNDAIFNRNRLVESKLDITIKETIIEDDWQYKKIVSQARSSVMAGDNEFDVMYIPVTSSVTLISEGCFTNLLDIDSLQLNQPWWNRGFNEAITLNGALYGAIGDANLSYMDSINMLAFNYELMENYKLDLPYDLVREGKWTLDEFNKYLIAAASLNGDDSAVWNNSGKTIYGLSNHGRNLYAAMAGCGELSIEIENDTLVNTAGSSRWYDVIEKLSSMLTLGDAKFLDAYNGDDMDAEKGGYVYIFMNQRALFGYSQVNKLQSFRDLPFEYGVLPYPKFDESQEQYYTTIASTATAAFIPVTNPDQEGTGTILDALSYESSQTVIPAFREISVEQKGLRNDDSIEMLGILTDSVVPTYYSIFKVGSDMITAVRNEICDKNGTAASIYESNRTTIEEQIKTVMESWEK